MGRKYILRKDRSVLPKAKDFTPKAKASMPKAKDTLWSLRPGQGQGLTFLPRPVKMEMAVVMLLHICHLEGVLYHIVSVLWTLSVCRFVRRWFRGRTTCARCDIEFRPYPHSALAERRDRTVSKTPVKHSSAGQAPVPKDIRKPEPRPEEKVLNN